MQEMANRGRILPMKFVESKYQLPRNMQNPENHLMTQKGLALCMSQLHDAIMSGGDDIALKVQYSTLDAEGVTKNHTLYMPCWKILEVLIEVYEKRRPW